MVGIITLFGLLLLIGIPLLYILLCVWAYRDSRRRGKSAEYGLLVVLGILFFPILGLIVYLVIRND